MFENFLNSPIILVMVPAIISFIVATMQVNNNKNNIEKQISAEIEKLEKQYEYEQKRDNKNYLNKLTIDTYSEIRKELSKFIRINFKLTLKIKFILEEDEPNSEKAKKILTESFIHGDKYPFMGVKLDGIMVFMPELEDDWRELSRLSNELTIRNWGNLVDHLQGRKPDYNPKEYLDIEREFGEKSISISVRVRDIAKDTISNLK